jgi:hypothetical protein
MDVKAFSSRRMAVVSERPIRLRKRFSRVFLISFVGRRRRVLGSGTARIGNVRPGYQEGTIARDFMTIAKCSSEVDARRTMEGTEFVHAPWAEGALGAPFGVGLGSPEEQSRGRAA